MNGYDTDAHKSTVRNQVNFAYKQKNKEPARRALFLPAEGCLCVIAALAENVITKDTEIVFAEKNSRIFTQIRVKLAILGFKNVKGYKSLTKIPQTDAHFDYMFVDLCGDFTKEIRTWVRKVITPTLTERSVFAITTRCNKRAVDIFTAKHIRAGERILERDINTVEMGKYRKTPKNHEGGTIMGLIGALGSHLVCQWHLRYRYTKPTNMCASILV